MKTKERDRVVVRRKMRDAEFPGFSVAFDPDEAELAGAFEEDALDPDDAAEGALDLPREPA